MRLLRKQVETLDVPWLEEMAAADRDPFKVLISCILSLRTQDRTTGEASRRLFSLASTPEEMASLSRDEIRRAIYPVGFYRVKAERIKELSETIARRYHGKVPDSIDELLQLRGVGRKTANLVVTLAYGRPGICVDTHVHRITNRWGYVRTKHPDETEFALRKKLPRRYWKEINGLLVAFGQGVCKPVSPLCSACSIREFCDRRGVSRSR
ncbi:MAG: endonuclease III [Nitrospirae bacterium]|nr:endonuclease III [Nitrospirota bacterium]